MLSSKTSHRLLSLLNEALHSCKEEQRELEEQLRQLHKLLSHWKTDSCEDLNQDDPENEPQKSQLSLEDVQEVELLNKALEKALKVRGNSQTESTSVKAPSVTQTAPTHPETKQKTTKSLNKLFNTGTKPVTYQLKAPYKTIPEKRRFSRPMRAVTADKTVRCPSKQLPPCTEVKEHLIENKEVLPRADSIPVTLHSPPPTVLNIESSKQAQIKQKPLTLKEKGATLKLPLQYQQLYTRNSRLWEKYYELQARLPASRPSFLQQLQTTFIAESPKLSLSEVEHETAHLQRAVRRLEEKIDTADKWQGSGPAHWQNYRSLLMLESLQDEVTKSHSELQNLQLVAEQYKKWFEKFSIKRSCTEMTTCRSAYHIAPPVLIYSHLDELCELTDRRLQVQELQQKMNLQKVLSEELLAEADSQCCSSPPGCLLLRAIYTQLCEGGDAFPVFVHDDA
ncbi:tubulin epsilon and delta complex protein 2 [Hyperolius riggenbachi]|uniref:tubulin epsilon and delta complex protein 2 n=1 Tax=Hyperolius riggenbachi TaxID=752182 RepID=UPI0035A2AC12